MKRLSTPSELQAAIDGNKREGRRTGYDTYSMFPGPRPQVPLPPSSLPLPQISPLPPGLRPTFNGGPAFPGSLGKHVKQCLAQRGILLIFRTCFKVPINVLNRIVIYFYHEIIV